MGSGCCKNTKVADLSLAVVQTQNVDATEIPYGYVFIYPGILTSNQTYTCPILSIHTYRHSSKKTEVGHMATQISNRRIASQQNDSQTLSREEHLSSDETVIMIPVEDVINIYYTSDVKSSVKAEEHSHLVPVVDRGGCCGSCCDIGSEPQRRTGIVEKKNAQRGVTIHLKYSKYSYLDTISNIRILPESDRTQFYKNQFQSNTELNFYLVRNGEYDSANFEQKKMHAENLCRVIMQLKGINGGVTTGSGIKSPTNENMAVSATTSSISYPSPQELQQILNQSYCGIFGDSYQERLHSIQTQQDFGTHAPVPITTTTVATIAMPPINRIRTGNDDKF